MIVGVGSWRGLGATTTAVAVAAVLAGRGERPWLIEADPAGGVLAARIGLHPDDAGTLERIAFPTARAGTLERFEDAAVDLAGIRLVTAPGDPFRAWACHTPRLAWATMLHELDGPVVVDLGTLRGGGPSSVLLAHLDLLLLTATADTVSLATTLHWASTLGRVSAADPGLPLDLTRIAVVDAPTAGERARRTDVEVELGDRFAGWLPWSPDGVAQLLRGVPADDRRLRRQPLLTATEALTTRLVGWLDREAAA